MSSVFQENRGVILENGTYEKQFHILNKRAGPNERKRNRLLKVKGSTACRSSRYLGLSNLLHTPFTAAFMVRLIRNSSVMGAIRPFPAGNPRAAKTEFLHGGIA